MPGDLSSAAFFLVAAAIVPGSSVVVQGVGLNPTRATLIDFLVAAGVEIRILEMSMQNGEPVGDLLVRGSHLKGGVIEKQWAAALIDEIPVLAILGAVSEEGLTVRDAAELRIKETDRIETLAANLRRMGVEIETTPDGFHLPGRQKFKAAEVDSFGDHRIAMALAVAALRADGPCVIHNADAASVSFPEFWQSLRGLTAECGGPDARRITSPPGQLISDPHRGNPGHQPGNRIPMRHFAPVAYVDPRPMISPMAKNQMTCAATLPGAVRAHSQAQKMETTKKIAVLTHSSVSGIGFPAT